MPRLTIGNLHRPTDPQGARAFCEGRDVSIAGGLLTDNPHTVGGLNNRAWARGWKSYAPGRSSPLHDHCAQAGLLNGLVLTPTVDPGDASGLTISFACAPNYPATFSFGDDSDDYYNDTGADFTHTFPDYGTYTVQFQFYDRVDTLAVEVTEPE